MTIQSKRNKLEIPLILEEWTNSRQFVYWSQMDTIEEDEDWVEYEAFSVE